MFVKMKLFQAKISSLTAGSTLKPNSLIHPVFDSLPDHISTYNADGLLY